MRLNVEKRGREDLMVEEKTKEENNGKTCFSVIYFGYAYKQLIHTSVKYMIFS